MSKILEALAEAAYNGLCLEAENGKTNLWDCQGVDAPRTYIDRSIIVVHVKPNQRFRVRIEEIV